MIPASGDPQHWLFIVAGSIISVGIAAAGVRMIAGPTLPDRVVALDLVGFQVVGILGVFAIVTQRAPLLSVAMVAAIILFLGTAGFAIYLERRGHK